MSNVTLDPRIAPQPPYAALIFDCDGTLADTMPSHFTAWVTALRAHGADMSEEHFYASAGKPTKDIIADLNLQFGYNLDVAALYAQKEHLYQKLAHSVTEIKAIADVARSEYGKVPLAVASGGMHDIVDETLKAIGIEMLFDVVIGADDVINGKPAPDMFLLAAERMGVAPSECIVYEDGEPGMVGARLAGMRVIDVRVLF
jgi:beta-phosphoglucomutase-like phosphatase (HAD superfamily)